MPIEYVVAHEAGHLRLHTSHFLDLNEDAVDKVATITLSHSFDVEPIDKNFLSLPATYTVNDFFAEAYVDCNFGTSKSWYTKELFFIVNELKINKK